MALRTSRKGVRLNDARHFQHYPPHTRKKMAIMRVFPKILVSKSSNKLGSFSGTSSRSKNPEKVIVNQRSEEVASFMYTDSKNSDYSLYSEEVKTQDQEIQTEIEPQPSQLPEPGRSKRTHLIKRHEDASRFEVTRRLEDSSIFKVSPILEFPPTREIFPKLEVYSKLNPNSLVTNESRNSNTCTEDNNSRKTSWWRNSIFKQFIVDFFLQLLGRNVSRKKSRGNMTQKYYSVATSTKDGAQRSIKSRRNDGRKCRSKKYVNSCEPTQHKRRVRCNKGDEVIFDLIRLTQDENLRATILEQALRTRILEEENARFRKTLAEKLKTRQRSSPLY